MYACTQLSDHAPMTVDGLACLLPTHKSWMKKHKQTRTPKVNSILWWFAVHTNTHFDWPHIPSGIVRRYTQNTKYMIYCTNLRQVTPRLCRLRRQHCQIISLICSIRIGKVYIQPQARAIRNIILKLFSVKFTVWLPLSSCLLTLAYTHTRVLSPKI